MPDMMYEQEALAAMSAGLHVELFSFEKLVNDQNPAAATRRIPRYPDPQLAVYRGWMLKSSQYTQLYEALQEKNLHLINNPEAYKHCHYFPESYPLIRDHTPKSVWLPFDGTLDIEQVMELLEPFGSEPIILKDYVKSRKHEWFEACYIPSASDKGAVEKVIHRFLELEEYQINGGLVFREFVEFQPLTQHSLSGMPLTKEFRQFFLDGEQLYTVEYWEGDYAGTTAPITLFSDVARQIQSRFFTMDVAQRTDGPWMIVELGDAQVAGLPESTDGAAFYHALADGIRLSR